MNRGEFDALVRKVEDGVGRDHPALRRRAVWLALIGYAGLLAWFILVVLIALGFFAAMLWADGPGRIISGILGLLVLVVGGWASLRILLVRLLSPKGRPVSRGEAPVLFDELDDLLRQLDSAPFHEVLLTAEFNAGVVQVPRLGVLGWPRNYLLLGLPLLDGLSRVEMRAVLAHEFVHLSREHGRLSHWLYRLRRSWEELFRQLAAAPARGSLSLRPLTVKFVDWFWPRFNAHAFVLSRANEYEADAQASRLTGAAHLASALVRQQILSRLLDEQFWPGLWERARTLAAPPGEALGSLRNALRTGADGPHGTRWSAEAFQSASTNSDTHPCLSDRLRALRLPLLVPAGVTSAAAPSAAETLLGAGLDGFRHDVQKLWQELAGPQWTRNHARAAALDHRLTALDQAVPATSATVESLWDKALVFLNLRDEAAATQLLREILVRRPDHAAANFQLGRLLLDKGNDDGESYLERAMAANEELVPQAGGLLQAHYRNLGRVDQMKALAARLDRHEKELAASRTERAHVTAKDLFLPHGLSAEELAALRHVFAAEPELARAELAQKELKYFPHERLFVLCVHRPTAWHRLPDTEADRALARRIAHSVQLPGRVLVFPSSGSFRSLARKLRHATTVWPVSE